MEDRSPCVKHLFSILGCSVRRKGAHVRHLLEPFRRTTRGLVVGVALWCAGLVSVAGATPISEFTEFSVPTPGSGLAAITAGPDGALWFTEGSRIGRITTTGTITELPLPPSSFFPTAITTGPDGALWFIEFDTHRIGRITTTGTVTEFPLLTYDRAGGITTGPDGALWFTGTNTNRIGRVTPGGIIAEFSLPTANSTPFGITTGPDGALWFTETGKVETGGTRVNRIGRITTVFMLGAPRQYAAFASRTISSSFDQRTSL